MLESLDPFLVLLFDSFTLILIVLNLFYYKKYGFAFEWESREDLKFLARLSLLLFSIFVITNWLFSLFGFLFVDYFDFLLIFSTTVLIFGIYIMIFYFYEINQRFTSETKNYRAKILCMVSLTGIIFILILSIIFGIENTLMNSIVSLWVIILCSITIGYTIYNSWIKQSSKKISPVLRFSVFLSIILIFIFQFYYFFSVTKYEQSIWFYLSQIFEIILASSSILLIYEKNRNKILDIYQTNKQFIFKRIDNFFLLLGLLLFIYILAIIPVSTYILFNSLSFSYYKDDPVTYYIALILFIFSFIMIYKRFKHPREQNNLDKLITVSLLFALVSLEIYLEISLLMPDLSIIVPILGVFIASSLILYVVISSARVDQIRKEQRYLLNEKKTSELLLDLYTHDLGNLLQSFNMALPLIRIHIDECSQKEYHRKSEILINRWNEGMKETIKLTEFLKLINKTNKLTKYQLNSLDILKKAIKLVKMQFTDQNIQINLIKDENSNFNIYSNELLLYAFRNILENAIIHNNSKEKKIDIICKNNNGYCRYNFLDNGKGFPENLIDIKINWDSFLKKPKKSGFGLYITNTIIEKNSGVFTIHNNRDMSGAEAIIVLPSITLIKEDKINY